jgi:CubicO group peptidase (beta-lactamase class C family)
MPARAQVQEWLRSSNVPAVGIGLFENGRVKSAKVFGELRPGVPAPDNTIFNVASLTKPIVTMLTLRLASDRKWNLDEPLSHDFVDPDVAQDPRHELLTSRIVLTHETGLPNWRGNEPGQKLSFAFTPGTDVKYSGEGFQYLRGALEHRFKQPLEALSRAWVFAPFGMKDTRHYWDASMDEARYAGRHDKEGRALEVEKWYEAHAANLLLTTVGDYSRFGAHVVQGAGITPQLYREMVSQHQPPPPAKPSKLPFGLGWLIVPELSNGEYALVHTGRNPGIAAIIILLPQSKRGVVVLTNGENGDQVYQRVIADALDVGREILQKIQ